MQNPARMKHGGILLNMLMECTSTSCPALLARVTAVETVQLRGWSWHKRWRVYVCVFFSLFCVRCVCLYVTMQISLSRSLLTSFVHVCEQIKVKWASISAYTGVCMCVCWCLGEYADTLRFMYLQISQVHFLIHLHHLCKAWVGKVTVWHG